MTDYINNLTLIAFDTFIPARTKEEVDYFIAKVAKSKPASQDEFCLKLFYELANPCREVYYDEMLGLVGNPEGEFVNDLRRHYTN